MSSMLEQAIVDATALREAALKNAEQAIIEKYAPQIKDIVNRTMQMQGYNALYIPGWDCHGLPIEWQIEKQYRKKGKKKEDVDIKIFREECREFASKWIEVQKKSFIRLFVQNETYLDIS